MTERKRNRLKLLAQALVMAARGALPAALIALSPGSARAEELRFGAPMIEIGSGGERSVSRTQVDILARISLSGVNGKPLKSLATVYGRVSGEVAIPVSGDGRNPGGPAYADIQIVPMIAGRTDEEGEHLALRALPVRVTRYLPVDEQLSIRVDLVGIQAGIQAPFKVGYDPKLIAFLNLTMDMLGYKSVQRLRAGADFQGLNLSSMQIEGGIQFKANEVLRARVLLGAEQDTSLGFREEWKPAIYSRFKAYARLCADIQNLAESFRLTVFAQAAWHATVETGVPFQNELQLMGGLMLSM